MDKIIDSNQNVEDLLDSEFAAEQAQIQKEGITEYTKWFVGQLHKYKAKITGSYARGEAGPNSDLDFYIPERKWKAVVELFRKTDPSFESCICGHVATRKLDVLIEASMLFKKQKNVVDKVVLFGYEFKTY